MSDAALSIAISHWADRENPIKRRLLDALREWAEVGVLGLGIEHSDLVERGFDLYQMPGWYPEALRDLRRADRAGVRTINPYYGARATAGRLARGQIRRCDGVRAPEFQYGRAAEITLEPPVIVKPCWELQKGAPSSRSSARARSRSMANASTRIRRPPPQLQDPPGRRGGPRRQGSVETTARIRGLTDRIIELFGLSLFEMDVVVHKDWYVIDVNPVVSLHGVEDGAVIYERLIRSRLSES